MICPNCGKELDDSAKHCWSCGAIFDESITQIDGIISEPTYAGFWWRWLALWIDGLIISIPSTLITILILIGLVKIFGMKPISEFTLKIVYNIFALVVLIFYQIVFESTKMQGSVGKRIVGIKCVDINLERLTFKKAFVRNICKVVSVFTFGIGFIMAGFTKKKQALHDIIAKTLVIRR